MGNTDPPMHPRGGCTQEVRTGGTREGGKKTVVRERAELREMGFSSAATVAFRSLEGKTSPPHPEAISAKARGGNRGFSDGVGTLRELVLGTKKNGRAA